MNIFEYSEFKNDIKKFFKKVLIEFEMKIISSFETEDLPAQNYVFIENENCIIRLDNIEAFPYPDVSYKFSFKDDNSFIDEKSLRRFLKIDEKKFISYIVNFDSQRQLPCDLTESEKSGYLASLISIGELISKFYAPLLRGEVKKNDYYAFIKNELS